MTAKPPPPIIIPTLPDNPKFYQRLAVWLAHQWAWLRLSRRGWAVVRTPSGAKRYVKYFTENTIRNSPTLKLAALAEKDAHLFGNIPKNSPW